MKNVKYVGNSDAYELSREDFEKANISHDGVTFPRGVPVEVTEQMAKALGSDEGIFSDHPFEVSDDPDEEAVDPNDAEAVAQAQAEATAAEEEARLLAEAPTDGVEAEQTVPDNSSDTTGATGRGTTTSKAGRRSSRGATT